MQTGGYLVDIQDVIYNMFGLKHGYCLGNWYVYFYLYSLLLIPCIKWLSVRVNIVVTSLVFLCLGITSYFLPTSNIYLQALKECFHYTPLLAVGLLFAKEKVFDKVKNDTVMNWKFICLFLVVLLLRFVKGSILGISTDIVFVPLLFMLLISMRQLFGNKLNKLFVLLGHNSTFMWFIHCLFFSTATRAIFQSASFWSDNIIIVFLLVTLVSLIAAMLLNYMVSLVKLNKLVTTKK